jgi:hypothetical protein
VVLDGACCFNRLGSKSGCARDSLPVGQKVSLDAVDSTRLILLGEVSLYFCTETDIWDVVVGKEQPTIYDADAPKHSVL